MTLTDPFGRAISTSVCFKGCSVRGALVALGWDWRYSTLPPARQDRAIRPAGCAANIPEMFKRQGSHTGPSTAAKRRDCKEDTEAAAGEERSNDEPHDKA